MIGRLLLCVALAGRALLGQDVSIAFTDEAGNGMVTARAHVAGGSSRAVGLGFVHVNLSSLDGRAHDVTTIVRSSRHHDADVHVEKRLVLESRAEFFLMLPIPPMNLQLAVVVDGVEQSGVLHAGNSKDEVGLFVTEQSDRFEGQEVLAKMPRRTNRDADVIPVLPQHVPTDWRMLTTFAAIVVDGRVALSGDRQESLRRFAFAGGTVVVAGPESLPPGVLRDTVAAVDRTGVLRHGLGLLIAIPPLGGSTSRMEGVFRGMRRQRLAGGLYPVAPDLCQEQVIAGLGKAPVTVFLLVILAFAVLVGPVNFIFLRRRKKPLLALLTVPLLGFGTTLVILTYGVLHDGFGVRGVVTSWTLLDQERHEAVTVSARTLFAGLAPNDLTMPPDVLLLSARSGSGVDEYSDRWHWDVDQERLDGGVLPSRTPTPLVSVQQGTMRERLTLRVDGDELVVLADGGIVPAGELVVRDFDGNYWHGDGKRLRRVDEAEGVAQFQTLQIDAEHIELEVDGRTEIERMPVIGPSFGEPGSYAARVTAAPWIHEHGMSVDYGLRRHFVFGRLQAQDFVK